MTTMWLLQVAGTLSQGLGRISMDANHEEHRDQIRRQYAGSNVLLGTLCYTSIPLCYIVVLCYYTLCYTSILLYCIIILFVIPLYCCTVLLYCVNSVLFYYVSSILLYYTSSVLLCCFSSVLYCVSSMLLCCVSSVYAGLLF